MDAFGAEENMEEIIDLVNSLSDDIIDTITDTEVLKPILEMGFDVLDSSLPAFKIALSVTNKIRVHKFKAFLEGLHISCVNHEINSKALREKLLKLSEKQIYSEFITNTFESAVNSKSIRNTAILGFYLSENAFFDRDINLEQFIICKALRELSDLEVEIFQKVYGMAKKEHEYLFLDPRKIIVTEYDVYSIQLVIEALKNYRIVGRGIGGFELSEQFGVCLLTETSKTFHTLIQQFNK
jgi:hypothetical protein